MEYLIKIDKYVKDRFKIYNDENIVYFGEKIGDVASYFDAFIGETYSKGANFIFFNTDGDEELKIERNFYSKNKKYKLFSNEKAGMISSTFENGCIEIDIEYDDIKEHISFNKDEYVLNIANIGSIESKKQGFRSYEEFSILVENKKYEFLLIATAVYIWDVFVKNKIAFISKQKR